MTPQPSSPLTSAILSEQLPPERLRDIDAGDDWFADARF